MDTTADTARNDAHGFNTRKREETPFRCGSMHLAGDKHKTLAQVERHQHDRSAIPLWKTAMYGGSLWALNASFLFMMGLVIPQHITLFVPSKFKSLALGIVMSIAALTNIAGGLMGGWISDAWGKRRTPLVQLGAALWGFSIFLRVFTLPEKSYEEVSQGYRDHPYGNALLYLFLLSYLPLLVTYAIINAAGKAAFACAQVNLSCLIPDHYRTKYQLNVISATTAFCTTVGKGIGFIMFSEMTRYLSHFASQLARAPFMTRDLLSGAALTLIVTLCCSLVLVFPRASVDETKSNDNSQKDTVKIIDSLEQNGCNTMDGRQEFDDNGVKASEMAPDPMSLNMQHDNHDEEQQPLLSSTSALREKHFVKTLHSALLVVFDSLKCLQDKNFALICLHRFFMNLGQGTCQGYLLYFLQSGFAFPVDFLFGIKFHSPQTLMTMFIVLMDASSLIGSIVGVSVSVKVKRSRALAAVSLLGCIGSATIGSSPLANVYVFLIGVTLLGTAFGSFIAIETALAAELIPDKNQSGRTFSVFAQSQNLAQIISNPLGGLFVFFLSDVLREHLTFLPAAIGYMTNYYFAAVLTLVSGICVLFIDD